MPAVSRESVLFRLTASVLGDQRCEEVFSVLTFDPALVRQDASVSPAELAMALNALLFAGLLDRVPTAAAYVADVVRTNGYVHFDHGALRTIDGPTGALPCGYTAFARILEPLGYALGGTYPLPALNMTGRAFVHRDFPESVPQFFVSELHVDRLDDEAHLAVENVFGSSRDPLGEREWLALNTLDRDGECPFAIAEAALPSLLGAFGRHHKEPMLTDYHTLLRHTAEGAWIATEGNMFNHATDRVADVTLLAEQLRAQGLPIKGEVELSANGRVRQTAFIADRVTRRFRREDGTMVEREVPGSFYEFITREVDPETGKLDLTFDSGNATGIFAVTSAA